MWVPEFESTRKRRFLKELGNDTDTLNNAGFSETDIRMIQDGRTPNGWNVHHVLPLDDGGTNEIGNLVLIKKQPFHDVITNYQIQITRGMKPGDSRVVMWPFPVGNIYPMKH